MPNVGGEPPAQAGGLARAAEDDQRRPRGQGRLPERVGSSEVLGRIVCVAGSVRKAPTQRIAQRRQRAKRGVPRACTGAATRGLGWTNRLGVAADDRE